MATKHITVRSTIPTRPDGGNVVALYETHEDHPDGEAYVAGPAPVTVARTGQVHRLISDGVLEEVDTPVAAPEPQSAPARPAPTAAAPSPPATSSQQAGPLDFLSAEQRAALTAAGYDTPEAIRAATDDQLDGVDGIGPATVARLREAVKE